MSYATKIANTLREKNALTMCNVEDCERRETAITFLPQAVTFTSGATLPMLDLPLFYLQNLRPNSCALHDWIWMVDLRQLLSDVCESECDAMRVTASSQYTFVGQTSVLQDRGPARLA